MDKVNKNRLYYGDNFFILRDEIRDESVDLIYLDPPFNSKANYNILFKEQTGKQSSSQIEAFDDTWHWTEEAESAFDNILRSGNSNITDMINAMRSFLGENDMMAYLVMMAVRLIELHRVLKPTGSIYLHCDPTASHYLKVLMDCVFDGDRFNNEIVWHYYNKYSAGKKVWGRNYDQILFYRKSNNWIFNPQREKRDKPVKQLVRENIDGVLKNKKGSDGKVIYRIADDKKVDSVWSLPCLQPANPERLGYPTQKPLALLERIIKASSNKGDVILDPFCGCGTAIHAAEKLGRNWIGIDITHLAISLIERRLKDAFPKIQYEVHGTPKDLEGARDLAGRDKYQFEWWALSLIEAVPYQGKKKGADSGIDGVIYFHEDKNTVERVIVSVKGGANVGVSMIRDLKGTMEREKAMLGLLITLAEPTAPMKREAVASRFHTIYGEKEQFPKIQIVTIEELLDGRKPKLPIFKSMTFRKAKLEEAGEQRDLL